MAPNRMDIRATSFVPKNEINVRELFAQQASRLGYRIIESRATFPDYVLEHEGDKLFAEAEFRTSSFLRHRHDLGRCDLILVWEHDLPWMPIPVLELCSGKTHRPRRYGRAGRPRAASYVSETSAARKGRPLRRVPYRWRGRPRREGG